MKHRVFFALILIVFACNNNKNSDGIPVASENGETTVAADDTKTGRAADATRKRAEELQKLSPYTLDQMKALLPAEIEGAKQTDVSANSANGAPYAEANYPLNDSTVIKVSIFDCAGDAGVGIYSMQYSNVMNFESVSDKEYTRTIDFNGDKAIEHATKDNSNASLIWLAADRLLVTLEGSNTGIDVLKKVAGGLKLK